MEGPGTRDAPRGWRPRWWRSYRQKKVRGSRVPGSVLCGSARTAALFHRLGAIKLPTSGPACSGPVPVGAPRLVNAEAFHARLHPSRAVELRDCPPCGMDACSISLVWRWRTQRSEIGRIWRRPGDRAAIKKPKTAADSVSGDVRHSPKATFPTDAANLEPCRTRTSPPFTKNFWPRHSRALVEASASSRPMTAS